MANISKTHLYDGDFIDLTSESELQESPEDDVVLLLDSSRPVESLSVQIQDELKKNKNIVIKANSQTSGTVISKKKEAVNSREAPKENHQQSTATVELVKKTPVDKRLNNMEVYDIVLTPSSSEIRNKKFPIGPPAKTVSSDDDDVILLPTQSATKAVTQTILQETTSPAVKKIGLNSIKPATTNSQKSPILRTQLTHKVSTTQSQPQLPQKLSTNTTQSTPTVQLNLTQGGTLNIVKSSAKAGTPQAKSLLTQNADNMFSIRPKTQKVTTVTKTTQVKTQNVVKFPLSVPSKTEQVKTLTKLKRGKLLTLPKVQDPSRVTPKTQVTTVTKTTQHVTTVTKMPQFQSLQDPLGESPKAQITISKATTTPQVTNALGVSPKTVIKPTQNVVKDPLTLSSKTQITKITKTQAKNQNEVNDPLSMSPRKLTPVSRQQMTFIKGLQLVGGKTFEKSAQSVNESRIIIQNVYSLSDQKVTETDTEKMCDAIIDLSDESNDPKELTQARVPSDPLGKKIPPKSKINLKRMAPVATLADMVETASAVAGITGNENVRIPNVPGKNPVYFILCPVDPSSGNPINTFKEGQVNQVLALVPKGSELSHLEFPTFQPPPLASLKAKDKKCQPVFKFPNNPPPKEDIEIEPLCPVTPVDIAEIINKGKPPELMSRCRLFQTKLKGHFKGFTKRELRTSSCTREVAAILKSEEFKFKHLKVSSRALYETNFVVCSSSDDFLPETIKMEIEEESEEIVELNESFPSISEIISKVNKEVFEMKRREVGTKAKLSKPDEALQLIKKGLELIQSWSQESNEPKNEEKMQRKRNHVPPGSKEPRKRIQAPVEKCAIEVTRGRPRKIVPDSVPEEVQVNKRRKKTDISDGPGGEPSKIKVVVINAASKKREPIKTVDVPKRKKIRKSKMDGNDDDDLLVVKKVDIIKSNLQSKRGRRK